MATFKHIEKAAMLGNPYVGLFAKATDDLVFVSHTTPQKLQDEYAAVLGASVVELAVNGSELLGIFVAANSNGIVLPKLASEGEVRAAKSSGLNVHVLQDKHTAVGNNVLANDKAALVSPLISTAEARAVGDCLGVETAQKSIGQLNTVGSCSLVTNKGLLAYNDAGDGEITELGELFGVRGGRGTANFGVPFVSLCVVANSKGCIVGEQTSGFEVQRIDEALGFI